MSIARILARLALGSQVMPRKLLIAPKTSAAYASLRTCSFLQSGCLGLRFVSYQCFSWFVLAIAPLMLPFASGVERNQIQVHYCRAITRINFVAVYGLLNDLLW